MHFGSTLRYAFPATVLLASSVAVQPSEALAKKPNPNIIPCGLGVPGLANKAAR